METTRASRGTANGAAANGNGNGHAATAEAHHEDEIDLNVAPPRPVWTLVVLLLAVGVLAALLVIGLRPRQRAATELAKDAAEAAAAPVMVNVVQPKRAPTDVTVSMPGNLRPWQEVSIFARTTGYLKDYKVDISEDVQKGELMAEIETPEVDAELNQARAALLQAEAAKKKAASDLAFAKVTYDRFVSLKESKSVALQDLDEKKAAVDEGEANLASADANVGAAQANVKKLEEMQSFEKIYAPFSGVVTGRAYDRGSLILANPTATDIKPMFKIAENDVLRAFVNVPQVHALTIKKGMKVRVTVRERPGRVFEGAVMGTTNYLDQTNRSLLTEVKVQNVKEEDGTFALLPGMFCDAAFDVKRVSPPLLIPGPAIVNNADGTQVAIVKGDKVHFQKVTLGQDFGSEVEVVGGLDGSERVISNPGERVVEGTVVSTGADAKSEARASVN